MWLATINTSCVLTTIFQRASFPSDALEVPSVLWRCWLGDRKGIRPVKNWVVRCWRGYLSGARCRPAYAQLMPLPLIVSCFSKIQIGFTFLVPAHPGSPGKGPLNGCVCVCSGSEPLWISGTKVSSWTKHLSPKQQSESTDYQNRRSHTGLILLILPLDSHCYLYISCPTFHLFSVHLKLPSRY